MPSFRAPLCTAMFMCVLAVKLSVAQGQQRPPDTPTIQVTSRLVFLDVTILDKKGHPVVKGLTKDDFMITEDKQPQRIFSFEAPETHEMDVNMAGDNPDGKAPVTIFVLDLLNSSFEDFAFIRYSVRKYLAAQPAQLDSPAELLVIGNQSLEMMQGFTRNKEDLLYALDHLPAALPYKKMNGAFYSERFGQSIDALQQIALQNKGMPGRKNIVWVGHGGPSLYTAFLTGPVVDDLNRYVHDTTNMLVDARISLFVIYPGLRLQSRGVPISELEAEADLGDDDPFVGDINFGVFVNETGGKLFYNRNDVDREITRSQELGSEYYTLTYQPPGGDADGKFRRIRVTLRDRNLRAITKAGYFAPDRSAPVDPRQQTMINIAEAAQSTIPFTALDMRVTGVVRHLDTRTAEFVVLLKSRNLVWQNIDNGKSATSLTLAAASLARDKNTLASKVENLTLLATTQDPTQLAKEQMHVKLILRVPRKTQSVRVVIQTEEGGRIGAVDIDRKMLDAAPVTPTPEPQLVRHPEN